MKTTSKTRRQRDCDVRNNVAAMLEGPTVKKKWSTADMVRLEAKSDRQKEAIAAWRTGSTCIAYIGSAGTGKTFLAVHLAVSDALANKQKVVLVRSTVQSRDQGFLKGSLEDKEAPFKEVYADVLSEIFGRDNTFRDMSEAKFLTFQSTSFQRGKTFRDSIIIADEVQNMKFEELDTLITRVGEGSRLLLLGDTKQSDIGKQSGLDQAMTVFKRMPANSMASIQFLPEDVVRSGFVKDWLLAKESST